MLIYLKAIAKSDPAVVLATNSPDSELSLVTLLLDAPFGLRVTMSWTELDNLHLVLTDALAEHEDRKSAQLSLYDEREV